MIMQIIRKAAEVRILEHRADASGHTLAELMERAGTRSAQWLMEHHLTERGVLFLCGKGNNGGDGYVAARVLTESGFRADVVQVDGLPATELAKNAAVRATGAGVQVRMMPEVSPADYSCVVDAVYGIGFRGGLHKNAAEIFRMVNLWPVHRVALDLPSGAVCDTCEADPDTFRAADTLSFMCIKPVHVHAPSDAYCGRVHSVSLDIPTELEAGLPEYGRIPDAADVAAVLPVRREESSKGTYGRALLLCGSWGMAGAAALAASGALKSGCGLVELAVPEKIYPILAGNLWEPVYLPLQDDDRALGDALSRAKAVLAGCGCGTDAETVRRIHLLTTETKCPLILDADGINCISAHKIDIGGSRAPRILTPHPGEMARLMGCTVAEVQHNRVQMALTAAKQHQAIVVLKGHHTVTACPDGTTYINPTGNSGMAKGGSGDLLAGMMVSLLAQGMAASDAAWVAVYLHGLAGDLCRKHLSVRTMQPGDVAAYISEAFRQVEERVE
jgi:NAD(P)H-hydrate epimerase